MTTQTADVFNKVLNCAFCSQLEELSSSMYPFDVLTSLHISLGRWKVKLYAHCQSCRDLQVCARVFTWPFFHSQKLNLADNQEAAKAANVWFLPSLLNLICQLFVLYHFERRQWMRWSSSTIVGSISLWVLSQQRCSPVFPVCTGGVNV